MNKPLSIAVIGGGAAGYFSALSAAHHFPDANICVYEKAARVLAKVKVSGGGRCNVTHACYDHKELASHYPRGANFLKKAFYQFDVNDTLSWFKERGVALEALSDNCIFPVSNSSQTIIDCFENEAKKLGIQLRTQCPILKIVPLHTGGFQLEGREENYTCDRVIVTTGGQPKKEGMDWLQDLGIQMIRPYPSLFTFNMPKEEIRALMGIVVENAQVKVEASKLLAQGPLLITHWGMSGPAILKLSAWGARHLGLTGYQFAVLVNWLGALKDHEVADQLNAFIRLNGDKQLGNLNPFGLPKRLWLFLLAKIGIQEDTRWKALQKKQYNKLIQTLIVDRYEVAGKTTFKEEFVTAGGVDLSEIDVQTMACKKVPGLYFAGEILDIDGITGGFNFQSAWTTGWIAGKSVGH